jgi:hypothetical protein
MTSWGPDTSHIRRQAHDCPVAKRLIRGVKSSKRLLGNRLTTVPNCARNWASAQRSWSFQPSRSTLNASQSGFAHTDPADWIVNARQRLVHAKTRRVVHDRARPSKIATGQVSQGGQSEAYPPFRHPRGHGAKNAPLPSLHLTASIARRAIIIFQKASVTIFIVPRE